MRWINKLLFAMILYSYLVTVVFGMENVFYVLRSDSPAQITTTQNAISSLSKHYKQIDILVSQAYQVGADGLVWGFVDPDVLNFAKQHAMKLMVLLTNAGFDKEKAHQFLSNPAAQQRAIEKLLEACQQDHYYGVQFDFEMIALRDRDALTAFYQHAADALHQHGFAVSIAVAPTVSEGPDFSDFEKRIYENWEGAYDFKALSQHADFMTVMAYNQHGGGTTPGPTASYHWVDAAIRYALRNMPSQKISLGVPAYSAYWYTTSSSDEQSHKVAPQLAGVGYDKVNFLLKKYHTNLKWDDEEKLNFTFYQHNWLYEYIFVEDAKSFGAKLDLAKKYHLRGVSVFNLGVEDQKIWDVMID